MLKKRNIFITGGSSGIGLACAKLAVKQGAKVTIMARNQERLDQAKKEIGENCWAFSGDVTNSKDVKNAVEFAVKNMGTLDGLVNAAGGSKLGAIHQVTDDDFDFTIKLNLYSTMYCMRDASAYMIENDIKGSIVNITSLNASVPYKMYTGYCAAKSGVEMLSKVACLDLSPFGIRVNTVQPGFTETPLTASIAESERMVEIVEKSTPLKRWGKPEDMAEAVCFLLSDKADYITGTSLVVDGGMENTAYPDIF